MITQLPDTDIDKSSDSIWIDYVACTGDGWNSTYSIASTLAAPCLSVRGFESDDSLFTVETKRGNILILGGNFAYPRPDEYERRLIFPFEAASPREADSPFDVFALPGDRDRDDGLSVFSKIFCSKRQFAGWRSAQENSYFALKLPHGWWLLGTDIPIYGEIDKKQADYFQELSARMREEDRVILCNTEPHWIFANIYQPSSRINENNLAIFESLILRKQVNVYISGGFHYYSRHEADNRIQKITSGGGGAFLDPTHSSDISSLPGGYELKQLYPSKNISKKLSWRLFLFPLLNPTFGMICALMYLFTWLFVSRDVGRMNFSQALRMIVESATLTPSVLLWMMLFTFGFLLFTQTHSGLYRLIGGSFHAMAHLGAIFFIGWIAAYVSTDLLDFQFRSIEQMQFLSITVMSFGWVVGSLIVGVYLFVSLNVFGRHANEAFAALAIPDWKHFIRMKIDSNGSLTIFPIGIRRVPRKWKPAPDGIVPTLLPDDPRASKPELIEPPITIPRFSI